MVGRVSRVSRFFAVALLAAFAASLLAGASPASATHTRGSITIHSRICPTHMPAGSNLVDQCHHRPGPDGAEFTVDNRVPKGINSSGNVSFGRVTSGDHRVFITSDFQPNEFLKVRAFCTNLVTGSGPHETPVRGSDWAYFWVWLAPGGKLVCDVYFIPISGQ